MAVRLTTDITIGNFHFSGVHEARIKRSLSSYVDMAWLILPSKARIVRKDGKRDLKEVITGQQFNDGDKVIIKLGYDGDNRTEFEGFVKRRNFNMPFEIEMEGYSYQLRRNKVSGFWKQISVKDLLLEAVKDTDITVQCDASMNLYNIRVTQGCGIDVLEAIKKISNGALALFFKEPKVLYCGLLYGAYASGTDVLARGSAKFRIGFNCPQQNHLRQRVTTNAPVIVHYLKRTGKGEVLQGKTKDLSGRVHRKVLNNIGTAGDLQKLADEKETMLNYEGYEGRLTAFLKPEVNPGYIVYVKNSQYPDRDGDYLADAVEVEFGASGARRFIDVAHKIGVK